MSAIPMPVPKGRPVAIEQVQAFLYSEARCLDDKDWDGWLAHYAPTATFWMPAWDDDDKLTEDPQREISLIWYGSKQGLEDRVFRIRTERSSATSLPEPRTSHNITNVELLEAGRRSCKGAVQLGLVEFSLQDDRHLFRCFVLHHRYLGSRTSRSPRRKSC